MAIHSLRRRRPAHYPQFTVKIGVSQPARAGDEWEPGLLSVAGHFTGCDQPIRKRTAGEQRMKVGKFIVLAAAVWACSLGLVLRANDENERGGGSDRPLNAKLERVLLQHRFTGRVESTLERRLGRPVNRRQAELGRLLFFDNIHSLH